MRQALLLLRKDLRRLWPQVAVFWALLAAYAFLEAATPGNPVIALQRSTPALALVVACFYLVAVSVHEDALVGDRQFWLTRPFDRRSLLAAKALFAVTFMALPIFVALLISTAVNGLPVLVSLAALAPKGATVLLLIAIAMAFAVVTRNLTQYFLALLAVILTQWYLFIFRSGWTYERHYWGGAEWVRMASTALIIFAGAVASILIMHRRYSTTLAGCTLAASLLLAPVWMQLDWWHEAWELQTWLSENPATTPSVSLRYDSEAPPEPPGLRMYVFPRRDVVDVKIPIRITGIPEGKQLIGERIRVRVVLPGRRRWDSGWCALSGIGTFSVETRVIPRNGADNLALFIDAPFFDIAKDVPAEIRARLAFKVLGPPETVQLQLGVPAQRVSSNCVCSVSARSHHAVMCFSADDNTTHREVRWDSQVTASSFPETLYSSSGISGLLSAWRHTRFYPPHSYRMTRAAALQTRHVENCIEVGLDIPEIRLRQYEVNRSNLN